MKVKDTIPTHLQTEVTFTDFDLWKEAVYNLKNPHKRRPRIETTGNHDEYRAVVMGDVVGSWDGEDGWVYTQYGYAKKVIAQLLQ